MTKRISVDQAREALDSMDDFARMTVGVNAIGARRVLEQFIAQGAGDSAPMSQAVQDVLSARARQAAGGFFPGAEESHVQHEMAHAAACYAYPELTALIGVKTWPWPNEFFQVTDHRSNYVRAAALLLAEIERLDWQADVAIQPLLPGIPRR